MGSDPVTEIGNEVDKFCLLKGLLALKIMGKLWYHHFWLLIFVKSIV